MVLNARQLLRAEVYPHPVRQFELLETHISWVVLTGDWAAIRPGCRDLLVPAPRERES